LSPQPPRRDGGLALALASDIRIAAASATFNAAFVRNRWAEYGKGCAQLSALVHALEL
jgi:enoyl-CoA hydratase/carnithine racemase